MFSCKKDKHENLNPDTNNNPLFSIKPEGLSGKTQEWFEYNMVADQLNLERRLPDSLLYQPLFILMGKMMDEYAYKEII